MKVVVGGDEGVPRKEHADTKHHKDVVRLLGLHARQQPRQEQ